MTPFNPSSRTRARLERAGFSLVELLVTVVLLFLVGITLAGTFVYQTRFLGTEDAMRDSRTAARAALNVLSSDLRMVQRPGGVVSAAARDVTLRVPYAFGVVCASSATETDVSLMPVDPFVLADAGLSGWAWRDGTTETYQYIESSVTLSDPGSASCDASSISILPDGDALRIAPGVAGLPVGTPIMLFQRIRYRFDESTSLPGRDALYRTVLATGVDSELVSPFAGTSRFRFHTDWLTAQDAVPADLSDILGLEIRLDAESVADSPRLSAPEDFTLTTSLYFANAPG